MNKIREFMASLQLFMKENFKVYFVWAVAFLATGLICAIVDAIIGEPHPVIWMIAGFIGVDFIKGLVGKLIK